QSGRRRALRASGVSLDLRHRRPDRGHAGVRREAPAELQAQLSGRALRAIRPEGGAPTKVCRSSALAANGVPSTPREPPFPPRAGLPQRGVGAAPPLRTACKARPGNSPSPTGKAPTAVRRSSAPAANGVHSTPNRLTTTTRQPHENWLYRTG